MERRHAPNPPVAEERREEMLDRPPGTKDTDPWIPSGMPEFKVGMRVRWRISPECGWKCSGCGTGLHAHVPSTGEGLLARIKDDLNIMCDKTDIHSCRTLSHNENHNYAVRFGDGDAEGFWAAASELVPIVKEGNSA